MFNLTRNRTRFLAQLDEMFAKDQNGALADMLQVLKKRGVILRVQSTMPFVTDHLSDQKYKDYVKENGVAYLTPTLKNEVKQTMVVEEVRDGISELKSEVWVVRKDWWAK